MRKNFLSGKITFVTFALTAALLASSAGGTTVCAESAKAEESAETTESADTEEAAGEEEILVINFPKTGFSFSCSGVFQDLTGQICLQSDNGEYEPFSGIVEAELFYLAKDSEWVEKWNALAQENQEEESDEFVEMRTELYDNLIPLFQVYGLNDERTQADLEEMLADSAEFTKSITELGSFGAFSYFLRTFDVDTLAEAAAISPEETYLEEYRAIAAEMAENPSYFTLTERVVDMVPPENGTVIDFETTDLEGNPVSSKELFAQNKVTMINIWTTWCGFCLEEFPELDAMNEEFASRGGAIVTYCGDTDSEEKLEKAVELTKDYAFVKLAASESADALLPYTAMPTSYFVDSDGRILGTPVVGAQPELYRERMEEYLAS